MSSFSEVMKAREEVLLRLIVTRLQSVTTEGKKCFLKKFLLKKFFSPTLIYWILFAVCERVVETFFLPFSKMLGNKRSVEDQQKKWLIYETKFSSLSFSPDDWWQSKFSVFFLEGNFSSQKNPYIFISWKKRQCHFTALPEITNTLAWNSKVLLNI